jgi:hypothetical protein
MATSLISHALTVHTVLAASCTAVAPALHMCGVLYSLCLHGAHDTAVWKAVDG